MTKGEINGMRRPNSISNNTLKINAELEIINAPIPKIKLAVLVLASFVLLE